MESTSTPVIVSILHQCPSLGGHEAVVVGDNDGLHGDGAELGVTQLVTDTGLELLAEGSLDSLLGQLVTLDVRKVLVGIIIAATSAWAPDDGGDNVQNKGVGSGFDAVIVAAPTAGALDVGGAGDEGDLSAGHVVDSVPVDVIVGRDVGLGNDGEVLLGGGGTVDALQDKGGIDGGHVVSDGLLHLHHAHLVVLLLELDVAVAGRFQVGRSTVTDLVAEGRFEVGRCVLVAHATALVGEGGRQETSLNAVIIAAPSAGSLEGGADGNLVRASINKSEGLSRVTASQVMSSLPVDVAVRSNEGLADDFHILCRGFTTDTLDGDLGVKVMGGGGVGTEGGTVHDDGGSNEGEEGRCELHGR